MRPAERRTTVRGMMIRAVAMHRTKSNEVGGLCCSRGVPLMATSELMGTLSGCSKSVASWWRRPMRSMCSSLRCGRDGSCLIVRLELLGDVCATPMLCAGGSAAASADSPPTPSLSTLAHRFSSAATVSNNHCFTCLSRHRAKQFTQAVVASGASRTHPRPMMPPAQTEMPASRTLRSVVRRSSYLRDVVILP